MRLSISILLLFATFAAVQAMAPLPVETREPKSKCRSVKTGKSGTTAKAPKSNKQPKSLRRLAKGSSVDECYCPCCDVPTCEAFMAEDSINGEDGFCVVAPFDVKAVCTSQEPCKYDDVTGDFDEDGDDCFADCCFNLGIDHYGCNRRNRRLNENSASNERVVKEHDDGIIVEVTAGNTNGLDWIKEHVDEMRERMEEGDAVRTWDPLFNAYFDNTEDIDMACIHAGGDVMSCKYSGASECAVDLIKAHEEYHSKIADSIRTLGTHEIDDKHAVPASCQP